MTWLWYRSLINQLTLRIHPSYVIFEAVEWVHSDDAHCRAIK
jgi:hypothetical protein